MTPNDALVFHIGEAIEVKTKDHQLIAGRVTMRGGGHITLTSDGVSARINTGAILSICRPDLLPEWARDSRRHARPG